MQPCSVVAPTLSAPGAAAGNSAPGLPAPPSALPAAAITSEPRLRALRTALQTSGTSSHERIPSSNWRLTLITSAPCFAAHTMPWATSVADPAPEASSTRTGISFAP